MESALNNKALEDWLLDNAGPAIRFRVMSELTGTGQSMERASKKLLQSNLVQTWLDRLTPELGFNQLHGAAPSTFESAMGKLTQLGCRQGMPSFDQRTHIFREWFRAAVDEVPDSNFSWTPFLRALVSPFLARAGYWEEQSLSDYLAYRLDVLNPVAQSRRVEIYQDPASARGIPKAFLGRPLIDPDLTAGGEIRLPLIYDLHLLANIPSHRLSPESREKIEAIIGYILDPAYQALPEGYGIIRADRRKYYAMGWSMHLPGYDGISEHHPQAGRFVQRMVLMSHFAQARRSSWYQNGLQFLNGYQTDQGRYCFPRHFLPESRSGYWVMGMYMGLEENRRTKLALEIESTFWMLKLLSADQE